MPFHVAGFLESLDPAAAFVNMAGLADDRLFVQGDDLRVPELNNLILAAGGAENTVAPRIRLTSPTLDELVRYEITPLNVAAAAGIEPGSPQALADLLDNPLALGVDEILQAEVLSNPAAAQIQWALGWFADAPPSPVLGERIFTVRATGTTTVGVGTWTAVNLTLDENLPPGNYDVVGARFGGETCIAGRIIFRTGSQWRPGALGTDAVSDLEHPLFRGGRLGVWGSFPFTQLPAAEYLCVAADTAQTVHLDLVRR